MFSKRRGHSKVSVSFAFRDDCNLEFFYPSLNIIALTRDVISKECQNCIHQKWFEIRSVSLLE